MPRGQKKEPGFRDMPVPGKNDLRPNQRDVDVKYGEGRHVLDFATGTRQIHDFGSPSGYPSQAPASARFTPGLRKSPKQGETDPSDMTIQPGVPRNR